MKNPTPEQIMKRCEAFPDWAKLSKEEKNRIYKALVEIAQE